MSQNPEIDTAPKIGERAAPIIIVPLDELGVPETLKAFIVDADPACHYEAISTIESGLPRSAGSPIVVVITAPAQRLQRLIATGMAPSVALEVWIAEAEQQLSQIRQARRQIILLDRDGISADPSACAAVLGHRLNLDFTPIPDTVADAADARPEFLSLLASLLIDCDPRAKAIADEFEATLSGPMLSTAVSVAKIDQAYSETKELEIENATMRKERAPLIADLQQMQDQMEHERMHRQLVDAATDAVKRKATLQGYVHRRREALLSAMLLRCAAQTGAHQNKIAEFEKAGGAAQTELKDVRSRLDATEAELKGVHSSLSWKVTAPLRMVGGRPGKTSG